MSDKTQAGKVTVAIGGRPEPVELRENPPRDNLVRALPPAPFEIRDDERGLGTLVTRFSVYNEWTEINSALEGRFMERIAPGAFDKTFSENGQRIKVLFNHGKDPQIGDKVLGPIENLRSEADGAWAEVPLFDTTYHRDLLPGLKAGVYGASFRFSVMRENYNRKAERSDHNPRGLPKRTILEARVPELGPVTFPAYEGAVAGVRSMTDEYVLDALMAEPHKIAELLARLTGQPSAPSTQAPAEAT